MKLFTREEWQAVWAVLNNKEKLPLVQFAELCNAEGVRRRQAYPCVDFSNARYECHIEQHLAAGTEVPPEIIASFTKEDLRYDWPSFPNLAPLLGYTLPLPNRSPQTEPG